MKKTMARAGYVGVPAAAPAAPAAVLGAVARPWARVAAVFVPETAVVTRKRTATRGVPVDWAPPV